MSHIGYLINEKCFHTIKVDNSTQDYGVYLEVETLCRSSAKDTSQVVANVDYYGVIMDIVLLDFFKFLLPIFQCDWANIVSGVKKEDGFTLFNIRDGLSKFERDPFILASQQTKCSSLEKVKPHICIQY
ncbi:hypothetical protein L3X38_025465 [Prunus dulcis]|uniref:Uncharacterized protein n=1 Tax=Prunus dulcis TaxID=3755 RepID=A0AAD4Z6E5_PRUDU|nr:hypothetical protein L3X38_025465 [Prunus dulcis]